MQATDTEEQADEDEDGQDMRRNDEAVESVVNATRANIDRRISEIQKLTDGTPGGTNILVMLHKGHEVVTYGLPIYGFCGAIVPSDGQIATVVRERSASVEEGGWGIPVELMKARISADLAAARRLPRATWPSVQAKFGITGVPTNVDYLQIPTLSGLRPYTAFPSFTVEANQLIPAFGVLLIPLRLCPEAYAIWVSKHSTFEVAELGELSRADALTTVTGARAKIHPNAKLVEVQNSKAKRAGIVKQQLASMQLIAHGGTLDEMTTAALAHPPPPVEAALDEVDNMIETSNEHLDDTTKADRKREAARNVLSGMLSQQSATASGSLAPAAALDTGVPTPQSIEVQGLLTDLGERFWWSGSTGPLRTPTLPQGNEELIRQQQLKPRDTSFKIVPISADNDKGQSALLLAMKGALKHINGVMRVPANAKRVKLGDAAALPGYVINVKTKANVPTVIDKVPPEYVVCTHHLDVFDSDAWENGGASEHFLADMIFGHECASGGYSEARNDGLT
ncbi:nrf-6 [Symbiodinium sp. KB8]|nr:nrf-6 [Symbiodinium sp. KB8]